MDTYRVEQTKAGNLAADITSQARSLKFGTTTQLSSQEKVVPELPKDQDS
jgi:hypothetical protein